MMLCSLCQNLVFSKPAELDLTNTGFIDDWIENPYSMISLHQSSRNALDLSAEHGCHVCALIWSQLFGPTGYPLPEYDFDDTGRVAQVVLRRDWNRHWTAETAKCLLIDEPIKLRCGRRSAWIWTGPPLPDDVSDLIKYSCTLSPPRTPHRAAPKPLDNFTGSTYNIELIKIWLRDCIDTHHACRRDNSPDAMPPLPTRVIDILDPAGPRIRESSGQQAEYLTLSYVWGQGKRLLNTRRFGRYEEFCDRIPSDESMPKTFREALQVTKALGYRFLWIDALCIIQDDANDVQREMARMGDIYRLSTLTISAGNGPNTDSGLFAQRDARFCKSRNVLITMKEGNEILTGLVSIGVPQKIRHSPLSKRGWVLQEELLSRRSLVFTSHQVEWRCTAQILSEETPSRAPNGLTKPNEGNAMRGGSLDPICCLVRRPDIFKQATWSHAGVRNNPFAAWYRIVEIYSRRALTVRSDKLLAVAGLASLVQESLRGTYGAGLWKEDLQNGLGWYVVRHLAEPNVPNEAHGRAMEYIAPSWSWASLHGPDVKFCTFEQNSDFQSEESIRILDWEVSHPSGAMVPFGHVTSARLTVKGRIRKALLVPCTDIWDYDSPKRRHYETLWCAYAVDPTTSTTIGDVALDSLEDYQDLASRYDTALEMPRYPYSDASAEKHSLWFLSKARPVTCMLYFVMDKYWDRSIVALVLSLHNLERNEYRRIGLLFVNSGSTYPSDIFSQATEREKAHQDYETIHIV